jgi:transcriptional regulator with XRE-family HTH domain
MSRTEFSDWLAYLLAERDIKPVELARMSNIDPGVVSRILNGERTPKPKTLEAIANALKLPLDTIYRAAGLLPPESPESELINQIIYITEQLPEEEQQDILEFVKLRRRLAEERGRNERTKRTPKRTVTS